MNDLVEVAIPLAAPLVTLAIGYAVARYGPAYRKIKQGFAELTATFVAVRDAWEDDEITEQEFDRIMTAAGEFVDAVRR